MEMFEEAIANYLETNEKRENLNKSKNLHYKEPNENYRAEKRYNKNDLKSCLASLNGRVGNDDKREKTA